MNEEIKKLLQKLRNKNIIGNKHITEDLVIKHSVIKLNKITQKEFYSEYHKLIREEIILKSKKRTGKGFDWHISLNPRKIREIEAIIGENNEISTGWNLQRNIW